MPQIELNMTNFITFLMILTSIINILNIVSAWREKRSDKSDQRFKGIEINIQEHHDRLTALEESTKRAPTHQDLSRIYDSINGLKETVHLMAGKSDTQTQLLQQLVNKAIGGHHGK